jgi:hypothetical protein
LNLSIPPRIAAEDGSAELSAPSTPSQLKNSGKIAYSSGERSLVKTGVESILIPFVITADAAYHNEARAGILILVAKVLALSIPLSFIIIRSYSLPKSRAIDAENAKMNGRTAENLKKPSFFVKKCRK